MNKYVKITRKLYCWCSLVQHLDAAAAAAVHKYSAHTSSAAGSKLRQMFEIAILHSIHRTHEPVILLNMSVSY